MIAQSIADSKNVGWFQGKNQKVVIVTLNRSILAGSSYFSIKDIINHTIKMREDFKFFAFVVLEEHYKEYFDTRLLIFMSRI